MNLARRAWWRGLATGWLAAAMCLALYARASAILPVTEPLHGRMAADADRMALGIFVVAAMPAVVLLLAMMLWERLRKS
ncbi:hypothetical protein [Sphingomonas abietis]|uniref:Uncharacterized protein n=1 Tax=Sphingomonas abietis TaxID=3012344 RepID=A0ABY7NI06_9SPHN|nr:hypothetical protein [Sphingomonas abietis]WBO21159.1 hypothetical protein PBT88_13235 [Sphingomonas abietis]